MRRTEPQPARSTARRRLRRVAVVALVVVLIAVAAAVLFRDRPRRLVEATLADRLAADVRVGRLEIRGSRSFALHDVEVRDPASYPFVASVEIPLLEVEGSLLDLREGRFESVAIRSPVAITRIPDRPAAPPEEGPPPTFGTVAVTDGTWIADAAGARFRFRVEAAFRDVPEATAGRVDLVALDDPWLALAATALEQPDAATVRETVPLDLDRGCAGLEARVEIEADTTTTVEVEGPCTLRPIAPDVAPIRFPSVRAGLDPPGEDGSRPLRATVVVAGLARVEARAALRPDSGKLRWRSGEIDADLGPVLAVAGTLPDGAALDGSLRATLATAAPGRVGIRVLGRVDSASWSADGLRARARAIDVEADWDVADDDPLGGGPLDLRWTADTIEAESDGGPRVPGDTGPWSGSVVGTVAVRPALSFAGDVGIETRRLGRLTASVNAATADDVPLRVDLRSDRLDVDDVLRFAADAGLDVPSALAASGTVTVDATARGTLAAPALSARVDLRDLAADLESPPVAIEATEASLRWSGGADGAGRVDLRAAGVRAEVPDAVALSGGTAELRGRIAVDGTAAAEAVTLRGDLGVAWLPARRATIGLAARVGRDGTVVLENGSVAWDGLATIEADGRHDPAGGVTDVGWRVASIDLPATLDWVSSVTGPPLPGYDLEIDPTAEGTVRVARDGSWTAAGTLGWTGMTLQSEDGARVVQGLDATWPFRARADDGGETTFETGGTTGGFVALWGRVFADYGTANPEVRIDGRAGPDGWTAAAEVVPGEEARARFSAGSPTGDDPGGTRFEVSIGIADLATTYERWVRAPLADSLDGLDRFRPTGRASVAAGGTLLDDGAGGTLRGAIRLVGVDLDAAPSARIAGLGVELPIDVTWTTDADGSRSVRGPRLAGELRFDALDVAGIPVNATATALDVHGDAVGLRRPVEVPVLGGRILLESLTGRDLATGRRRLEARLTVDDVRLDRLSTSLGLPPLEGSLEAAFPRVGLTADVLTVEGGGTVDVFGGRVRVGDVSGRDLLSRYPRLILTAEFEDIDLGRVTRVFDFGEMTGIVRGHVRDCELFRGVPVRFDAALQSVERDGVRQTVTVKAIDNLTILGTGGRASVFDRGIHRFLDRYGYVGLGMTARLEDDVFLLRGTERRGERELFLKGKLPFRLDIVNVRPGQPVSFRSMLDRLSRLDLSAASTGGSPGSGTPGRPDVP